LCHLFQDHIGEPQDDVMKYAVTLKERKDFSGIGGESFGRRLNEGVVRHFVLSEDHGHPNHAFYSREPRFDGPSLFGNAEQGNHAGVREKTGPHLITRAGQHFPRFEGYGFKMGPDLSKLVGW
jgi:hypothetical protein